MIPVRWVRIRILDKSCIRILYPIPEALSLGPETAQAWGSGFRIWALGLEAWDFRIIWVVPYIRVPFRVPLLRGATFLWVISKGP